jgi:hypothetical protein
VRVHDPSRRRSAPARHANGGFWHYLGPDAAGWDLRDGVLALARLRTRFARARRFDLPAAEPCWDVRFSLHALPEGTAGRLTAAARARGVKVNDLLTAAVAQACDLHGPCPREPGREDLAVGAIVDVRPLSRRADLADAFGMFLGFTTTVVRGGDLPDWPRTLRSVAAQSALHRRTRAAAASTLRLAAGLLEARFFTPDRWSYRYRMQMPMAAGLSNVTLNDAWPAAHHPRPLVEYFRVSPTSPLLPIVFTPTTLGDRLNLGVTRLSALIDESRGDAIIAAVRSRLCRVAAGEL